MMLECLIFLFFQGLAMNGFQLAMGDGMILSGYKKWLKKQKPFIGKMLGLCVVCSSSIGSVLTFWPAALFDYGFKPIELFAWVMDIACLGTINLWIYKKL